MNPSASGGATITEQIRAAFPDADATYDQYHDVPVLTIDIRVRDALARLKVFDLGDYLDVVLSKGDRAFARAARLKGHPILVDLLTIILPKGRLETVHQWKVASGTDESALKTIVDEVKALVGELQH